MLTAAVRGLRPVAVLEQINNKQIHAEKGVFNRKLW